MTDSEPVVTKTTSFTSFPGKTIHLRLLKFSGGAMMLWIGDDSALSRGKGVLDNLSLGIGQTATAVIENNDTAGQAIARKLSVKFNNSRPVYVTIDVEAESVTDSVPSLMSQVNAFVNDACGYQLPGDTFRTTTTTTGTTETTTTTTS